MNKFLIYYFIFLVFFLSIFCSGVFDSQDGFTYLAVARNLYYTGKPTDPPYEYNERKNVHLTGGTGLGYSLALVPAVAITDIFYKIYHITPPVHFPLENDWLILFSASFTNTFFAALFGVIMYLYFIEIGLTKKQALFISLVSIFATNLFVYAKNSFAHMMFVSFLTLSFYMIKKYFVNSNKKFLIFAGLAYGVVSITYNGSFLLTLLPLLAYFVFLRKFKISWKRAVSLVKDLLYFSIGLIPFVPIFIWFENLKASGGSFSESAPAFYVSYTSFASSILSHFYFTVFMEGVYGQLLSPGRSIFLYSPILLIIIFFWHKIKPAIKPELIVLILMALLYIPFYAAQFTFAVQELGIQGLWHGESSWGPRYLTPLIPFAMLIVGSIFQILSKMQRYLFFYPLVIVGLYVELLGVIMPYQIKLYNLDRSFSINSTEFTSYTYTNLIPRYSPILTMSKSLAKLVLMFPKTFDHGEYNTRLYDGIDFAFDVGRERWRVIEGKGFISFDNWQKDPVKKMTFGLINHPVAVSSSSAKLQFNLNNNTLLDKPLEIALGERKLVDVPINYNFLKENNNQLEIEVVYDPPLKENTQISAIISYSINDRTVNLESLDFPYVSPLGPAMVGASYKNYGGLNKDPWKTWDIHTHMYERTPDFWWVKALYYWDYPRSIIKLIFIGILVSTIFFGIKLSSSFKHLK